jgi:hypothetical protein
MNTKDKEIILKAASKNEQVTVKEQKTDWQMPGVVTGTRRPHGIEGKVHILDFYTRQATV